MTKFKTERRRLYLLDPVKTDIRVIKTKRAIRDATLLLLSKKHIDDISVTELAITAQINRKTFYNYYQNIYQVVDEIENEIVEKFANAIRMTDWYNGTELNFHNVFSCVTEAVRENMEFFRPLLNISNTSIVIVKVESALKERGKAYFKKYLDIDEDLLTMALDYIVSGMFSVFRRWLQNAQALSVHEVTEQVGRMSLAVLNAILPPAQSEAMHLEF